MMDQLFDAAMTLFTLLLWGVIIHPKIKTGGFGSFGLIIISVAAVLAADDSLYTSIQAIQETIFTMCAGVGLCIVQLVVSLRKAGLLSGATADELEQERNELRIDR